VGVGPAAAAEWALTLCMGKPSGAVLSAALAAGAYLHSSNFQLNLSHFGHTSPCSPV
jgi:hypothetical protein